jgi:predicted DNA-binding transcriptional regulator AlpA
MTSADIAANLPRFGLSRGEAAHFVGVSPGLFDRMIDEGVLPSPRIFGARKLWLIPELQSAMMELPTAGQRSSPSSHTNPWDGAR